MKTIEKEIIDIAYSFLDQEEIRGNQGFKDERFNELMSAVGFEKGQAWCAYFTELVWRLAYANQNSLIEQKIEKLFSAGAVKTYNNFENDINFICKSHPTPGDLVIWQNWKNGKPHWTGHAGIVVNVKNSVEFQTIEGNTNDNGGREGYKVCLKDRFINYGEKSGLIVKGFVKPKQP